MISTCTVISRGYAARHVDAYLSELVELLHVAARVVFRRGQLGRKKGIDERRLSQSALALRKQISLGDDLDATSNSPTTITVK